jgi:hypothetical protein
MSDHYENDELLNRLRAEDPAKGETTETPGERDAVRTRARVLLASDSEAKTHRPLRLRLVAAALIVLLAVGVGLALSLGGSSSGPAQALAIEKTPKLVTLRITNPNAPDAQMNQELADAGIDRVRVHSVPGAPKAVGTWAGYVELGPHCLGGVTRYGYDVDFSTVKHYNRRTKHGSTGQFDLTLPRHPGGGALTAQEAGQSGSTSTARIPTNSIDDPRVSAKILIPVRPKGPDDPPDANDIGVDQLIALGGVFAQYGEAIQSGHTSCQDFGMTQFSKAPFPPSDQGWPVVDVTGKRGGARKMTRELRSGGINGKVRQIPAQHDQVGRYMSLVRVPPLPKHLDTLGGGSGAYNGADVVGNTYAHGPTQSDIALRLSAFNADPKDRWIIYIGRRPKPGETPKLVGPDGPVSERAAARANCEGFIHMVGVPGLGHCGSIPVLKVRGQ